MSRETDSSSSGPQGRGGAAYPSGTPPYGSPAQNAANERGNAPDDAPQPADPAEPKTETTLTTRIRINIPGSRPIPPVVMRTPVAGSDATEPAEPAIEPAEPLPPLPTRPERPAAPDPAPTAPGGPTGEKTSDWFAPRKGGATRGGSGAPAPTARTGGGAPGTPNGGPSAQNPAGPSGGQGNRPGAPGSSPFGSGATGDRGPTGTPGNNATTGSFDVSQAVASGPLGTGTRGGTPTRSPQGPPAGPTSGPMTGDAALRPPLRPESESGTTGQTRTGEPPVPPRMSDDTAVLTPQPPAPTGPGGPGGPGASAPGGPGGNVSGDTLTSGIPVVPPAAGSPFRPGAGGPQDGPLPHTPPRLPEPLDQNMGPASPPTPAAQKKGRSKLVFVAAGVVVVAGGLYGAGLLMGHGDVPTGTTVLGVDIGGGTRDDAVKKLDDGLGQRVNAPLQLSVDGKNSELKPSQSGLTLDSQATVRAAAAGDYNPVTVIGSLFGGERVTEPVMPVDEEKLADALERVAGVSGTASDGSISFATGKAVPVYGKPGKALDVDKSIASVEEAYRAQVQSGKTEPVAVPVGTRNPTVPKAEVDRMMKKFAEPAMSGIVTIKAGSKSIPFGPEKSLPKILGVQAIDGKLVDTYDKEALKKLYGNTFDGVLITRGTGEKTPVTPQDVIGVMRQALMGTTPAERIGEIETDPS